MVLPVVGGHGAEMRISPASEACAIGAHPMSRELRRKFAAIGDMSDRDPDRGQGLLDRDPLSPGTGIRAGDL